MGAGSLPARCTQSPGRERSGRASLRGTRARSFPRSTRSALAREKITPMLPPKPQGPSAHTQGKHVDRDLGANRAPVSLGCRINGVFQVEEDVHQAEVNAGATAD